MSQSCSSDIREDLITWTEKYYNDLIIFHDDAKKSLKADKRNLDWHKIFMMIHYIAGYTAYRNDGGVAINPNAAREYDPELKKSIIGYLPDHLPTRKDSH